MAQKFWLSHEFGNTDESRLLRLVLTFLAEHPKVFFDEHGEHLTSEVRSRVRDACGRLRNDNRFTARVKIASVSSSAIQSM